MNRHWEVKAPVCGQRWKWWIRSWAQEVWLQRALNTIESASHSAWISAIMPLKDRRPQMVGKEHGSALLCQPQFSGSLRGFQRAFWPGNFCTSHQASLERHLEQCLFRRVMVQTRAFHLRVHSSGWGRVACRFTWDEEALESSGRKSKH